MRELQARRGYQEVSTPILVSERLWQQSGHWDLYRDNMFIVESEDQTFSLKPMNCPESRRSSTARSCARTATCRCASASTAGSTATSGRARSVGLTRVRQFIQDDAHLYVRPDQLTDEIEALLGEVREAYGWFGLEPRFAFATQAGQGDRRPGAVGAGRAAHPGGARRGRTSATTLKPKDGTFYAPKIDIYIDDALGREWQMATIQVDLTMLPERFDLTYIDENGQPQRPIAIHRAIYGSLERFIGILVEHFAGAFPLWLAPVQAVVIPIADRHIEAAEELAGVLRARGLRVEVDDSDNRMQNKIRLAQEQKVPYMLVLGDREIEARTVAPRARRRGAETGEQQEAVGWDALADRLAEESRRRGRSRESGARHSVSKRSRTVLASGVGCPHGVQSWSLGRDGPQGAQPWRGARRPRPENERRANSPR